MNSGDSLHPAADLPVESPPGAPDITHKMTPSGTRSGSYSTILILAILAGLAAWLVGEVMLDHFKPSEAASSQRFTFTQLNKETEWTNALNGAVAFGALGGLLGLAMGLAGGISQGSGRRAALAAVLGLILGAVAGALPALGLLPWHWRHRGDDPARLDMLTPLLLHMGLWAAIGLTSGLAFAVGTSGVRPIRLLESALAGLVGAMLGTFLFEAIGAVAFPMDHTTEPFSATWITRLLARLCVALFVGLGAIRALPPVKHHVAPGPA